MRISDWSSDVCSSDLDGELQQFASAAIAIQRLENDSAAALADKEPMMAAAVQQSGLTPQRFNEIAEASNADPALMPRIHNAVGKMQGTGVPRSEIGQTDYSDAGDRTSPPRILFFHLRN